MASEAKLARCIRLLDALVRHGPLANRDIRGILDVDRRTALRDVESLEACGVPVVRSGKGAGLRYGVAEGYRQTGLSLHLGEALALEFGRQLLGFLGGTDLGRWMDDLQSQLGPAFDPGTAKRLDGLRRRLLYLSEPYRSYEAHDDVIDEIVSALLQERELTVEHEGRRRRVYHRLEPLGLVIYRRALYLVAREPGSELHLRLAVDRIRSATRRALHFDYPDDFDLAEEMSGCFGIYREGEPEEVLLRFAPRVARFVRARTWHPTQSLEDTEGGGVILRMESCGPELVRLALEFGPTVEVLAPEWLREAVVGELKEAVALYAVAPAAVGG